MMNKNKNKLSLYILLGFIGISIIFGFTYWSTRVSYVQIKEEEITQLEEYVDFATTEMEYEIEKNISSFQFVSRVVEGILAQKDSFELVENYLLDESKKEKTDNPSLIGYYGSFDNQLVLISNSASSDNFIFSKKRYYEVAEKAGVGNVGFYTHIDKGKKSPIITFVMLMSNEKDILCLDCYLENIKEILPKNNHKLSYFFLINESGLILESSNSNYAGLNINYRDAVDTEESIALHSIIDADYESFMMNYKQNRCYVVSRKLKGNLSIFLLARTKMLFKGAYSSLLGHIFLFFVLCGIDIMFLYLLYSYKSKAIHAEDLRNEFLERMSHELLNPVNNIIGMNDMIKRENNGSEIKKNIANIHSDSQQLLQVINDSIDRSFVLSKKMNVSLADYKTASLINEITQVYSPIIEERGLEFKLEVDPKLPSVLNGDEGRIRQITTKLLSNALRYTKKGSITLSFSFVKIRDGRLMLHIDVADTGIGVKKDVFHRAFAEKTNNDELDEKQREVIQSVVMIKTIVELMEGHFYGESQYETGTTMHIEVPQRIVKYIPIAQSEVEMHREKVHAKFTAPDKHILVVDDIQVNLSVFTNLLKHSKIDIDTATSGTDALKMASSKQYDMFFIDLKMPEMDGRETMRMVKEIQNQSYKNAPFVAVDSDIDEKGSKELKEEGFSDCLAKPIKYERLEEILKKHL